MNKMAVGIGVIILGAVVGWYLMQGKIGLPRVAKQKEITAEITPSASDAGTLQGDTKGGIPSDQTSVSQVAVTYTDNGFAPKVIRVKAGTSVTFDNRSATGMWVISDAHPTHRILPGLNEKASAASGGSYTYVFNSVGTWPYHNEVNLSAQGTVIVE